MPAPPPEWFSPVAGLWYQWAMKMSSMQSAIAPFLAIVVGVALLFPLPALAGNDKVPVRVLVSCNEVAEIVKTMPRGTASGLRIEKVSGQVARPDGVEQPGCAVGAQGSLSRHVDDPLPHERVREMMLTRGWAEAPGHAKNGPDGNRFALTRKGVLCIFFSTWLKTPDGNYHFSAECMEQGAP